MSGLTLAEIKQRRPFESATVELSVNLLRTTNALQRRLEAALRPSGLSLTQYNVLRILRGAGAEGLGCGEIASRMITRDPDMTRLLDRLERAGWICRARSSHDRRVVNTQISATGLKLLRGLDRPMLRVHEEQFGHLGARRIRVLIGLLEDARAATGSSQPASKSRHA